VSLPPLQYNLDLLDDRQLKEMEDILTLISPADAPALRALAADGNGQSPEGERH